MTKHTKKDGGTKQKGKSSTKQKLPDLQTVQMDITNRKKSSEAKTVGRSLFAGASQENV